MSDRGITIVDLPPISPAVLDSFHGCTTAERAGQVTWYRRALRFHITWTADDDWFYELVGADRRDGVVRFRDVDFTPLLGAALSHVWLDVSADWLIELTQIRTLVPARHSGPAVPPGRLTGDAEIAIVAVAASSGLTGGEVRLSAPGEQEPRWRATIAPGQALLVTRPDLTYALDAGHAVDDGGGVQDTLVITLSRTAAHRVSRRSLRAAG